MTPWPRLHCSEEYSIELAVNGGRGDLGCDVTGEDRQAQAVDRHHEHEPFVIGIEVNGDLSEVLGLSDEVGDKRDRPFLRLESLN